MKNIMNELHNETLGLIALRFVKTDIRLYTNVLPPKIRSGGISVAPR